MKYFLVLNPGSRGGQSGGKLRTVISALRDRDVDCDFQMTRTLSDACELSRRALRAGFDVVVAVGGDGTINRVLNGFFDQHGRRISNASLGVLHTGTSPDFCKSYGIPHRLDLALETLARGRTKKITVARISLETHGQALSSVGTGGMPRLETRYFACCANIGIGASVARLANARRKTLGDTCGTLVALLRSLSSCDDKALTVVQDGGPGRQERLVNLSIGKSRHVASGIRIENELAEGDGRFYCLHVRRVGIGSLLPLLRFLYTGRGISETGCATLNYCRCIEVSSCRRGVEVEFDGDPQGFLPCRIEMAEDSLDLIVESREAEA